MTIAFLHGVPDEALLTEMSVFVDPLKTAPRYQPGINGVAASLIRLESVIYGSDWQSISSVLGDMAMCMNIKCRDFPFLARFSSRELESLYREFEEAVDGRDECLVRSLLGDMLHAAGLTHADSSG